MFSFAGIGYLFLGGVGAGLGLVSGLAAVGVPRAYVEGALLSSRSRLMTTTFGAASAVLLLAALLLLADAGNPRSIAFLFFAPSVNYMTVGA